MESLIIVFNQHWGDITRLCVVSGATGLLAHVLYFVRGTHNKQALGIASVHLLAAVLLYGGFLKSHGIVAGSFLASAASFSYLAVLFASIAVYRLWFHPLAQFPGPLAAKLTKFYGIWISRNEEMHLEHTRICDKYGDMARIGPNELVLRSADAIQKVHGAQSKCDKSDTFYEFVTYKGELNIDSQPRREEHRWRRQVWDRALNSKKAQERYEEAAMEVTRDWMDTLSRASQLKQPVNTSHYALLVSFDNIGKAGYSEEFGTVKSGTTPPLFNIMETCFKAAGQLGQLAWPLGILNSLGLDKDSVEFGNHTVRLVDKRLQEDSEGKEDIIKYMIEDMRSPKPRSFFTKDVLYADAQAILVGGSDTIGAFLSYALYELAKEPARQATLRAAVTTVHGKTIPGAFMDKDLEAIEYLSAFINETLRMYSPVCNNGQRTTPPEGITVDGVFIPGGTHLIVPVHSINRHDAFYEQPDEFIVERWTTRPELVREKAAFHPFLIGSFNCVGKRLALCLIRHMLASTVWRYDFQFAPGETGKEIHEKARNQLILKAGPLHCVFSKRKDAE
ncbi:cytochrome P450 [Thozetella sp. PMI_491]|nr:cytochrome P450 [Thozetella sp. PMI_491]